MGVLREMINDAPQQVEDIDNSISQIDDLISDYNDKITAMEDDMASVAESNLTTYLEGTKMPAIGGDSVVYGPNYGTIDYTDGGITEFSILDSTGNTIYEYAGVGWDSDVTIVGYVDDYDFANDYLTRPLTSGATYGLIPSRDNLSTAKAILEDNKSKIEDSITDMESYA